TGSAPVSTLFDVPQNAELGASTVAVVANGISSAPVPITVFGTDELLAGTACSLKSDPANADKRRATITSRDATIALAGGPGSPDDPRTSGAILRIAAAPGGAFDRTYRLPAAGWTALGTPPGTTGYRYRDAHRVYGPVRELRLQPGRQLKVQAAGSALDVTLDANPGPVDVVLAIGSVHYCLEFGGAVTYRASRTVTAKGAPPPSACR